MKLRSTHLQSIALALALGNALSVLAQPSEAPPPGDGGPDFDGPPPFGPGGFGPGPGGPGGMMQPKRELVKQFDRNGDKWLNNDERKAAREFLSQQGADRRRGGPGGRRGGFGPRGDSQEPAQPGPRVSPADVKSFPEAPLYASNVLRTVFLEFENADWEKELEAFHGTDIDVPAKLTVDGRNYSDVGVHFRGASSYMMLGSGRKRSLNLSLDLVHPNQNVGGYRTLNLLNSHGDPTFLRTVLYFDIAREYLPAPKANLLRVVINGESWGVYVSVQQFNKDFVQEWFGTKKGARWKVPGSPRGRGSLASLGDDVAAYRGIYEIKSKEDPKSWADLIKLCRVLNETSPDKLEAALTPLLDIDGALKFLALENALINNDGYWVRTSDYDIYQEEKGRFHLLPYDANETFSLPGGPGFGGGPGGPGGPGGFGPGMFLAPVLVEQADKNRDGKLVKEEFTALADAWFDKLDPDKAGKLTLEQFTANLADVLPPPPGQQGLGARGGRDGFGPAMFVGRGFFVAGDGNKDGLLTRAELKNTFAKWFTEWDADKAGSLNEEKLRVGLSGALVRPDFGGPGGPAGGQTGRRGPGGAGFGGGPRVNGVELDPLIAANDSSKPLLSKLLAVPALRTRYLGYVREIAETQLDWNKLSPRVQQYQALIADAVKADTRKLSSFEAFEKGVAADPPAESLRGPGREISLKSFADRRRAYLLNHAEIKKLAR
ncbi:MAG: CotH kinase family protein [Verrucomicrobia bacterium]|nr:CotH kinase family protein [Verrucomicrobiota bacterium]